MLGLLFQYRKRFPTCVTVHRSKPNSVLLTEREEAVMLPPTGAGVRALLLQER